MRPVPAVVVDVLADHCFEVTAADDEHPVEALPADGADEALGKCFGTRGSDRCADGSNALGAENLVEASRELGVAIPDQELDRSCTLGEFIGQVPGLLEYPGTRRMRRHSGHEDTSGIEVDEDQDVERPQEFPQVLSLWPICCASPQIWNRASVDVSVPLPVPQEMEKAFEVVALGPPLREGSWPVKTCVVDVPAESVSVTLAV
jgi:hypothetical protein